MRVESTGRGRRRCARLLANLACDVAYFVSCFDGYENQTGVEDSELQQRDQLVTTPAGRKGTPI